MVLIKCAYCGKEFKQEAVNQKYCCPGCKTEATRKRAREWYAAKKAKDAQSQANAASKESRAKAVKTYHDNRQDVFIKVHNNVDWGRGWLPRDC